MWICPVDSRIQDVIRLQEFAATYRKLAADWVRFAKTRPLEEAGKARCLAQIALFEAYELEWRAAQRMER